MPDSNAISLIYYGGDADENRLNLYDASVSYEGLARTLAILGHYYVTGEIITKAPNSAMPLFLAPPEAGSFKQTIITGIIAGIVAAPFNTVANRVFESWVPPSANLEMLQLIQLQKEMIDLMRRQNGLPSKYTKTEEAQVKAVDKFIKSKEKDLHAMRSITSQSFKKVFRPIDSGAVEQMGMIGGPGGVPKIVVNADVLSRIEADAVDPNDVTLMATVESFSRRSKTGYVYSRDYMSGIRIEFSQKEALKRGDDFTWSAHIGKPIKLTGRFVRYFDGTVKKLLVNYVERVTHQPDIDDYFNDSREVLSLS